MPPLFWADKLAEQIVDERGEKDSYVFNSGMSISGVMHIGNLRGELIIPSRVKHILEEDGKDVAFRGVYYTQDRFKGKKEQLEQFDDLTEAEGYVGWRLIDVPDPEDCHENWVEHFNSQNHPHLPEFGIQVEPITTTEFYRMDETKDIVRLFLEEKDRVREVLNDFRERNPYPENWIPFDPLCEGCNRIDTTTAHEIDFGKWRARYSCDDCGEEGWSDMEKGKLGWRLEWTALWHVLSVDFEPYGKDHATPGGSRDSCVALAEEFDLNYPTGFSFNWVYLKEDGNVREMTSSGNVGITAREFLDIAEPEVLSFLYLSSRPMSEIYFSPEEMPTHYRRFDRAERVYFGEEDMDDDKREENLERIYELSVLEVPSSRPLRVDFEHAAFVAQTVPRDRWEGRGMEVLERTDHIPEDLDESAREQVLQRLRNALNWAERYAPEEHVYEFNSGVPDEIQEEITAPQLNDMKRLRKLLAENEYDTAEELEDDLFRIAREGDAGVSDFFTASYLCLLSREEGPRLADFIITRGQDEVLRVLQTIE